MLTGFAIAIVTGLALVGWIMAWHARGEALACDRSAAAADQRCRLAEAKSSAIRLSDAAQRDRTAAMGEQVAVMRVQMSSLQLQLDTALADSKALREQLESIAPTGGELYESTTPRLRFAAKLARMVGP